MYTPYYKLEAMKNSFKTCIRNANILVDRLEEFIDQNDIDIEPFIAKCTFDIVTGQFTKHTHVDQAYA